MSLGFTEIILIIFAILILFGAKRIPELARSLGRASYEFKKAKNDLTSDAQEVIDAAEADAEKKDKQQNNNSEKNA